MFNICLLQNEINARSKEIDFFENLSKQSFVKSFMVFSDKCSVGIEAPILHTYYIRHLFFPKIIFVVKDGSYDKYSMYSNYGRLIFLENQESIGSISIENTDVEKFLKDYHNDYSV
jgi:hypothetical protein